MEILQDLSNPNALYILSVYIQYPQGQPSIECVCLPCALCTTMHTKGEQQAAGGSLVDHNNTRMLSHTRTMYCNNTRHQIPINIPKTATFLNIWSLWSHPPATLLQPYYQYITPWDIQPISTQNIDRHISRMPSYTQTSNVIAPTDSEITPIYPILHLSEQHLCIKGITILDRQNKTLMRSIVI